MALTTSTIVALAAAAAAAGVSTYNTNRTLSRQDAEAARGIERQGRIQRNTDQRVNEEVANLERSSAMDERAKRLTDYMTTLSRVKRKTNAGLENGEAFGNDFVSAANDATTSLAEQGATRADLMAGVDAPGLQRQGEAFNFGRLATDVAGFQRESSGADWLTRLRMQGIRRSPGLDALASTLQGVGSAAGTMGGGSAAAGGASAVSDLSNDDIVAMMRWGMGGT
jgi:hypothetical protein